MKDELSELTGAPLAVQLKPDIKPGPASARAAAPVSALATKPACRRAR